MNYKDIINKNSWIIKENKNCILSPDTDGLLSGLFMSHYLNWNIVGFYDGKIMLLKNNYSVHDEDTVFLDMEIYRKNVKSIGHHMQLNHKKHIPPKWDINFNNCIQPNNIRVFDRHNNFKQKYPLATIHLLLPLIAVIKKINIPDSAICPLLYVDGVFKNLFNYPENCIEWITFLKANDKQSPLNKLFFNKYYTIYKLMDDLNLFFKTIGNISKSTKRNDKIKISNSKGEPVNIEKENTYYFLTEKEKAKTFIKILSELTKWQYSEKKWNWSKFNLFTFTKKSIKPNIKNFNIMIDENPLSWAITSGQSIEYTIDNNHIF